MNKSILLVDDEPDIIFTITNILEDNKFKVYTFDDPVIALKFYKTNSLMTVSFSANKIFKQKYRLKKLILCK